MKLAQQFYMEREIAALQEKLATEKEKVATRENALRVLNEAVMKLAPHTSHTASALNYIERALKESP